MAALTTMAVVGAAALGAGAQAVDVMQKRKAAKEQKRMLKKQEEAVRAREAAPEVRTETGANVKLGRSSEIDSSKTATAGRRKVSSASRRVGGLSASRRVGL